MATRRNAHPPRSSSVRTFLIADIRGYTRFTAELGDEAGSRLATKFAQVMAEGIEAWGGELVELAVTRRWAPSGRPARRCASDQAARP